MFCFHLILVDLHRFWWMKITPNKRLVQFAPPIRETVVHQPVHLRNKQSCTVMEYAKWVLIILQPQAGQEQGRNCSWKPSCTHRSCQPYHERQPECSGTSTNSDLHTVIMGTRTAVYSFHPVPSHHSIHLLLHQFLATCMYFSLLHGLCGFLHFAHFLPAGGGCARCRGSSAKDLGLGLGAQALALPRCNYGGRPPSG